MRRTALFVAAAAGLGSVAQAEPTFFVFQNEIGHRFTLNGQIETFTLTDRLMGSSLAPDGVIRGTSSVEDANGWNAYALNDPFGSPSLSLLSDTNTGGFAFVTYVGNTCYSTNSDGELLILDPVTLAQQSVVGNMGIGEQSVGAGYDAATDTFYMINKETDSLYTVDYTTATPTLVGNLGFDWFNAGAEFFGGKLYAAIQQISSGELLFGEVDTATGAFTSLRSVATFDPNGPRMQVSLAIIPAPAGAALLGLAGLAAMRRRR